MKYNRFEELPVWKDAIELAVKVFALTSRSQYRRFRSIRDQIERAAMSVSNNIAEGLSGEQPKRLLRFFTLLAARAAKHVRSFVSANGCPLFLISNLRSQI